jgi:NAD(P)-dependent dehydrogenase (short-subunit alcohol dehydrogenase family)
MHCFDLSDRCAVVIGGTSGLGKAIALGLAEAKASVVATSRRKHEVESTATEIEVLGRETMRLQTDVRNRASLQTLHDQVAERFGKIDILVNSAGITQRQPTIDCSEEMWTEILDINLLGTLRACQIFGKDMLARQSGVIINIASLATFAAFRDVAAYGASKAGVGALTKSLAVEWAQSGVRVNAIAPGIFPTSLNESLVRGTDRGRELLQRTPMGRFGQPQELAGTAVFLASDASSFVSGQIIVVDGGYLACGVNC